jgi:hypothetical protein
MKQQFLVTHTISQTEILALIDNWDKNWTSVKMIVIISPTHAQFTSLLYTLARVYNKEVNCACVGEIITIINENARNITHKNSVKMLHIFVKTWLAYMLLY